MTTEPKAISSDEIAAITIRVLAGLVAAPAQSLHRDVRLFLDLGLTSGRALELVMLIEDELGLDLEASSVTWTDLETLDALIEFVVRRANR